MSTSTKMPPRKTRNKKATAAASQAPGDDTTATYKDQLEPTKWHHNFLSVKRIFDQDNQHPSMEYPKWLDNNSDYSHTTHEGPVVSELEAAWMAKKHQEFKYPKGVLVNFLFKATMGSNTELAPCLAFRGVLEMNSYVDSIGKSRILNEAFDHYINRFVVADLVHQAALVVHNGFQMDQATINADSTMV